MARSRRSGGEAVEEGGAPSAAPAGLSFEAALAELEGVVSQLESGDMPLEQALEAFESGVKLSRQCAATLDAAERRIEILMAGRSGLGVEPFGAADPGAARSGAALSGTEDDTADIDLDEDLEDDIEDDDPGGGRRGR